MFNFNNIYEKFRVNFLFKRKIWNYELHIFLRLNFFFFYFILTAQRFIDMAEDTVEEIVNLNKKLYNVSYVHFTYEI